MTTYKPLRICAHMLSSVCGDVPMLDALLEYVVSFHMSAIGTTNVRHRVTPRPRGAPLPMAEIGRIPIGMRRDVVDGLPIPRCSSPILERSAWEGVVHVHRRWSDGRDLLAPDRHLVVNTTGGPLKSSRVPIRARLIPRVVWFAVGDAREIRRRLRQVHYLGKKTSYGHGRVARWEVMPWEEDLSWFAPCASGSVLMRPLPSSQRTPEVFGARADFGSPCPPYWQRTLYREIILPC